MKEVRDLLIGLDIGPVYTRIACYDRADRDAECISPKADSEEFNFPTVLFKGDGEDDWTAGRRSGVGEEVQNLFEIFTTEKTVWIKDKDYKPSELLTVYIRGMLEYMGVRDVIANIKGIIVTSEDLGRLFARNLNTALFELFGKDGRYSSQDYDESFFHYCMYHNTEVYRKKCALVSISNNEVSVRILSMSRDVKPYSAKIRNVPACEIPTEGPARDTAVLNYVSEYIIDGEFSAVYITGNFVQEAYPQTTTYLCRDQRHVFAGDNLFVKGASLAAYEKAEAARYREVKYIGKNVLSCDLTMAVIDAGKKTQYPLLISGRNWFESGKVFECMLRDDALLITKTSDAKEEIVIDIDGLPERPDRLSRAEVRVTCVSEEEAVISVTDLGFGDFYPSSGKRWRKTIHLKTADESSGHGNFELPIMCHTRRATVPFEIECISKKIYSIEELCYFFENYPELLDADIIGDNVIEFVEEELKLEETAKEMQSALREGEDLTRFLTPVFRASKSYSEDEIILIRENLRSYIRKPLSYRLGKKGDALAGYGKYVNAINAYRKAIKKGTQERADDKSMAHLYHNMGAVYMRMLLYEESLDSFKKAYIRSHSKNSLETYLLAAKIARPKSKYEEILSTLHVDDETRQEIDRRMNAAIEYAVPPESGNPKQVINELVKEYRDAAGMPFLGE